MQTPATPAPSDTAYPSDPPPIVGAALLAVASLGVMANALVSPALPHMRDAFAATPHINTLIGLVVTLPSLGIVLTAGAAGWLNDRIGRKPVMLSALFLYGVVGIAALFTTSLWTLLATRFLLGVAIGGTMTSAMAMIADRYVGAGRVSFMSTQAVVMSAASMAFVITGGLLGEFGWRYPFLLYGLGFAAIPMALALLPETKPPSPPAGARDKLDLGPLLIVGLTALMAMILFYMVPVRLPFHLHGLGYTSSSVAGLAVAFSTLTMSIAAMLYSRTAARLPIMVVYAAIFLCTGVGFITIGHATSLTGVLIGSAIAGAGNGWLFPANNLLIMNRAPPHQRGRASGFHTTCIFTGQFLSPLLSGPIIDRWSTGTSFIVFGFLSAGVAIAFALHHSVATKGNHSNGST
jgi:MFS family permease